MSKIRCVSLCGDYHVSKGWYDRCASSWHKIEGVSEVDVIDDGSLSEESVSRIQSLGHNVVESDIVEDRIDESLRNYPNLKEIRDNNKLVRKIVDTNAIFEEESKILFLDSDVYFRRPVKFPQKTPSIIFTSGDVSGYGGYPTAPLRYPVVLGINSGIILWDTDVVDWSFLEEIAERGMLKSQNKWWWVEQFCWALLAARADSKGMFDGRDVRNISGTRKRTPQELKSNVTKWIGDSSLLENRDLVEEMVSGSSVLHFPGQGKRWIHEFTEPVTDDIRQTLRWCPIRNARYPERVLLALKLWWQG